MCEGGCTGRGGSQRAAVRTCEDEKEENQSRHSYEVTYILNSTKFLSKMILSKIVSLSSYFQRKRKKGGLKLAEDGEGGSAGQQEDEDEPEEDHFVTKSRGDSDVKQKKKADDLWASFLSDVGPRPKASAPSADSQQVT